MRAALPQPAWTVPVAAVVRPVPVLLILAIVCGAFLLVVHPWMMTWGSTPEEQAMPLPGDAPRMRATDVSSMGPRLQPLRPTTTDAGAQPP
jgi:hypothetical protein